MQTDQKSLLVRADFLLGKCQNAGRVVYHRWRKILIDALPRLLGCARRCPQAERVCLHRGEEGRYSAWLRIPVSRRPGRSFVHKLETKLKERLQAGLQPIQGEVLKVRIRRCQPMQEILPLFEQLMNDSAGKITQDRSHPVAISQTTG